MSGQLAKLFIRGNLVNVTAKNLTEEQKKRVSDLMEQVWSDRALDTAKHKFCNVLGCTIGNEYKDKELAMGEIWITIWRTAVDVLYHHPKPNVVENEEARRKYFKNCIYMYMRQILNENKIPSYYYERTISGNANSAACEIIQFYLDNVLSKTIDYTVDESSNGTIKFHVDVNHIPEETMQKIWKLRDEIRSFGILTIVTDYSITIVPEGEVKDFTKKVSEKARVSCTSLSGLDQDDEHNNFQQYCEYQATKKGELEVDSMLVQDSVEALLARLPSPAKEVCQLLIDTPKEFLDEYYPKRKKDMRPKEIHIAKHLGISKNEVVKAIKLIQQQAAALDIS